VRAHTFDGDTPGDARKAIRVQGDIVVSNPDMLHQAILPHHTKWAQFFEQLRYVVIDEIHNYRGVFGSHLANVLRRLLRVAAFYGAAPRFVLCSATIGNPQEHAEALLGKAVHAVTESGAPQGPRTLLFWNPPVLNAELGIRASARSQSTRLARLAVKAGFKTLVFAQSRVMVELIAKYLKDVLDRNPLKPSRVRAYRGGYLPNERRATERALREGTISAVVSTSALELGVDIGALDVTVLNGYPRQHRRRLAALRPRRAQAARGARRAGGEQRGAGPVRRAPPGVLRRVAAGIRAHRAGPAADPARPHPLRRVRAAVPGAEAFGGIEPEAYLEVLAETGVVHRDGPNWHWIADSYPANAVSLRSVADGNFVVVDRTGGRQTVLAEVDYSSAALTLYEGAIYLLQSEPFQVERLDWTGRKAYVTRTHADYYTDAIDYTKLKVLETFAGQVAGAGECRHGEVHVVRRVAGYKKIRYYTHENIGYGPVNLPDQEMHTSALWWQLPGPCSRPRAAAGSRRWTVSWAPPRRSTPSPASPR
jgi:DEAD/DEAH box helicase domain-containing protein